MKKRVTLKHIADTCGYSVNTVSRALRNDPKIPEETIAKIRTTADKLGYIQNLAAASLRTDSTRIIAIVVEDIRNPHYTELIVQLSVRLRDRGYRVVTLTPQGSDDYANGVIQLAISSNIDGMLFFPYLDNYDLIKPVLQHHIPLVLVDREIHGITLDAVHFDDYNGGYLAGKALAKLGHKKYLYLSGPLHNGSQPIRQSGFMKALEEENVDLNDVRVIHYTSLARYLFNEKIGKLLLPVDYTAVFSFNDQYAYRVMTFLQDQGYRIPEDISIAGFDHIRSTIPYLPPLTSVAGNPGASLADKAIELLLRKIEDPALPCETCILPVTLIDDGTIAPAKTSELPIAAEK